MMRKRTLVATAATAAAAPGSAHNVAMSERRKLNRRLPLASAHRIHASRGRKLHTRKLHHNRTVVWG
jgi:hypothetical protein